VLGSATTGTLRRSPNDAGVYIMSKQNNGIFTTFALTSTLSLWYCSLWRLVSKYATSSMTLTAGLVVSPIWYEYQAFPPQHSPSLPLRTTVHRGRGSMLLRPLLSLTDALLVPPTYTWYEQRVFPPHSLCPVLQLPSLSPTPSYSSWRQTLCSASSSP
jgi:hypothetical protein